MIAQPDSLAPQLETLSPVRRRVRFTIAAQHVDAAFRSVVTKLAQTVRVPGFRPGKVPPQVVERQYLADVRNRVLDKLLRDHVFTAIEQTGAKSISAPEIDSISELAKATALEVAAQFEVMAELVLTGYAGAALQCPDIVLDSSDVAAELAQRQKTRTEMVGTDGPAQSGDEVVITYDLTTVGSDTPYQSVQARKTSLDGVGVPAPVLQAFVGKLAGEVVDTTVTLPPEGSDSMLDSQVRVIGSLEEITRSVVPVLDDELAIDLGYSDLAALTAEVQAGLAKQVEQANFKAREMAAITHLVAVNEVPVPQSMVDRHVDNQLRDLVQRLGDVGKQMQGFLRNYRQQLMAEARTQLQRSLAVDALADAHQVAISDDDLQAELERVVSENAKQAAAARRHYSTTAGQSELKFGLRNRKAVQVLIDQAQWTTSQTLTLQQWQARDRQEQEAADSGDEGEPAEHVHGPDCDHDHGHDHDHHHDAAALASSGS